MRHLTCCVLILLTLNSCVQWKASHLPLDQALRPDARPKTVRVWLIDDRSIELHQPTVTESTVEGTSTGLRRELVVIPRDSVKRLEIRKSVGAASGVILVMLGVGGMFLMTSSLDDCFPLC